MYKNKKPTRAELKEYISYLEQLLLYSSLNKLDSKIPMQLVPKRLSFEFKKQLAKNNIVFLYSENTEAEVLYNRCLNAKHLTS